MAEKAPRVIELHAAVKRGDLAAMKALLDADPALANARSETDTRGTYPLHVAAEFGQAAAAHQRALLDGFLRQTRSCADPSHGLPGT